MIWRTMLCMAAMAVALGGCGCGGKDDPLDEGTNLEQFFGSNTRVARDRSVRLQVPVTAPSYPIGGPIELEVFLVNGSKSARTLPVGMETTQQGAVLTYFSAAIKAPGGEIKKVTLAPDTVQGDLLTVSLDGYGDTSEKLVLSSYYPFDEAGTYQVVLFYTVKEGKLPGGSSPEWTGTVWTSPIAIEVE